DALGQGFKGHFRHWLLLSQPAFYLGGGRCGTPGFARWTILSRSPTMSLPTTRTYPPAHSPMKTRQAVITEPFKTSVREVDLPDPQPNQILVAAEVSCVSAGTELAVYTGTHQWLQD